MTAGVPDVSVTCAGRTTWLEAKVLPPEGWLLSEKALRKRFDALQLATMIRLQQQGRALYVVGLGRGRDRRLEVHLPMAVAKYVAKEWLPSLQEGALQDDLTWLIKNLMGEANQWPTT